MELSTLWFILIGILFTGFLILEGFDFGVGILLPWVARTDEERRAVIRTIGPVWDGNEVWLLTAGGAIFAAFPRWYATMFSALYLPFVLLLLALIVRASAFEWRNKKESAAWRRGWDRALFIGSLVPAFLVGVALTNLIHGIPFDGSGIFQGHFLDLIQPFPLLGGLASLTVFTWIGALFLQLKLSGDLLTRAQAISHQLKWGTLFVVIALGVYAFSANALFAQNSYLFKGTAALALVSLIFSVARSSKKPGQAFAGAALAIAMTSATLWGSLYPNTMVSSLHLDWNITVQNASSNPYTLKIMSIVALIFVPIVLLYQGWTYWVFRKRVHPQDPGY